MNTNRQSGRLARAGFTLIELLVVMMVILILAALTLRIYQTAEERARANRCKNEIWQLEAACEAYRRDNGNRYPPDLLALVNGPRNYIDWPRDRIVPGGLLDPWGGVYVYKEVPDRPDVYNAGQQPLISNGRGDIANRYGTGATGAGNRS